MNITKSSKIFLGDTEIYRVEYQGTVIWKKQVVPPTPTGGTIAYDANGNVIASTNESVIPNNWLADNKNVASVVFADNVTNISQYAFNTCSNLTSVTFNSNLQVIGIGAFISCNLSTVDIPDSVTTLSDWCFDGNHNLTQVNGCNNVEFMGDHAFYDCALTSFTIPTKVTSLNKYALGSNPFTSIIIPAQVTSIGDMCFASCTGLTEIICESETEITNFGLTAPFNNIPNSGTLKTPNSSSVWSTFLSKLPSGWKQEKKEEELPNYLRFVGLTPPMISMYGTQISFSNFSKITEPQYSFDAENWTAFTKAIYVPYMQTVYFRAKGLSEEEKKFTFGTNHVAECHGDVRSLLAYDNFENMALTTGCFYYLFYNCRISTAPELPATTLANYCYMRMFDSCPILATSPELPATVLTNQCYRDMFYNCTNLTTASEISATTLADNCCYEMFCDCTNLTTAPSVLPATNCYYYRSCYSSMFKGCSSLSTAPEIMMTRSGSYCYSNMFQGCLKLNYIKIHEPNWSIDNSNSWLAYVSSTGTFVKPSGTEIPSGTSGIPNGWTVENY